MADSFVTEWDADAIIEQIRQRRAGRAQTQLGGALSLPAPPIPGMVAPAPPRQRNIVERILEPIGRPQQALFGLAEGGAPAAWRALQGQGPRRTAGGMLERAGVPELGSVNLFGKQFTGRGALGAVGDIGVDPLNIIPFGKVAGALRGAPAAARAVTGIARPMELGAAMTRFAEPTAATRAVRAAAQAPIVGGVVRRIANMTSKRILETDPVMQRALASLEVMDTVPNAVTSNMARFISRPLNSVDPTDPQYLRLRNGVRVPYEDVARTLHAPPNVRGEFDYSARLYRELLDPEDVAWFDDATTVLDQTWKDFDARMARAVEVNPTLAKELKAEALKLGYGERYFPRDVLSGPPAPGPRRVAMPGRERDFELRRKFPTQQIAINRGYRFSDAPTALRNHLTEIQGLTAELELGIELAPLAQAMGLTAKEATKAGLAQPGGRALRGLFFDPATADKLKKTVAPELHPFLGGPQAVSQASRTLRAGFFDWSSAFIQSLPTLATNPVGWLKGFTIMARSFVSNNPQELARYVAENAEIYRAAPGITTGLQWLTEPGGYFAGLAPVERLGAGLVNRLPGVAQGPATALGRGLVRETFERSQLAFQAMGVVARTEWAKALLPGAQKAGKLRDMEDLVNFGTGVFSARARGITPNQTAIEGTFLVFAPSYTKSALALTGMILGNSYSRSQALKSLGSMLVAGVTMYDNLAQATGQEPVLDPTDSRFLTLEVGGQRVGIGGVWTALTRLLGKSVIAPRTDEMDFGQIVRADRDNPLVRFFWGREAPVGGALWDLAMQESYMGEPLDSPINLGKYAMTRLMPFAVEAAFVQGLRGGIEGFATEQVSQFAGLRGFPEGLSDVREDVAQEMFQQPYRELTPEQKGQVDVDNRIRDLPTARGKRGEESRARARAFEREREALEPLAQQVRAGTLSKYAFRKAYNDIAGELGTRIGDIEERFPSEPSTDPRAVIRDQYLSIMRDETLGEERFDRAEEFYASLPPELQAYIESAQLGRYERIGGEAAQLLREYWGVKKVLKPYWEIFDQVLERRGLKEQWDNLNDVERRAFTQTRPYSLVNRDVTRLRERLRRTNNAVDAALVEWYGLVPIRMRKS